MLGRKRRSIWNTEDAQYDEYTMRCPYRRAIVVIWTTSEALRDNKINIFVELCRVQVHIEFPD
jgi:hypothetical protein